MPLTLERYDPTAVALVQAIRAGDTGSLRSLLDSNPGLASARLRDPKRSRTPLHVATDWPGYFPNGPAVVRLLTEAGADPNAPGAGGSHRETPLHWAASSDDLEVADALIDAGADIEADGGLIAGGTPLDNAVGYGCWHVARRLVERGARVDKLWHAAATRLALGSINGMSMRAASGASALLRTARRASASKLAPVSSPTVRPATASSIMARLVSLGGVRSG